MPIDPIKIPQNVYIEDRIVGPLTLKQILIVALGCGFSYAMFAMLTKATGGLSLPATIVVWIPGGISVLFAFVKINDLSMFRIVLLMLERVNKPVVRTWAPRRGIAINIRTFSTPQKQHADTTAQALADKQDDHMGELSRTLDSNEPETREAIPRSPVDASRVVASPPIRGSVSIMRDLSPAKAS